MTRELRAAATRQQRHNCRRRQYRLGAATIDFKRRAEGLAAGRCLLRRCRRAALERRH